MTDIIYINGRVVAWTDRMNRQIILKDVLEELLYGR